MCKRKMIALVGGILALLLVTFALTMEYQYSFRIQVYDFVNRLLPSICRYQLYYQNNQLTPYAQIDFEHNDVREVQVGNGTKYLVNHPNGYALALPRDAQIDFSLAADLIRVESGDFQITISKEHCPYPDGTKDYVCNSINQYLLDQRFLDQNKITLYKNTVEKIGSYWMQVISLERIPAPTSSVERNTYFYCYIYTGVPASPTFYRIMFKTDTYTKERIQEVYRILYSFTEEVEFRGEAKNCTNYKPTIPKNWSEETRQLYEKIRTQDQLQWGIFLPQGVRDSKFNELEEIETQVGYQFDGMLEYLYYWEPFPMEGMQEAYEKGKIVELTFQVSTVMHEDLYAYNPAFDVLDGVYDQQIRSFASDLKQFGHPVLFRLNNEMNSNWTSYSGVCLMNDPDLYIQIWRRIYQIFQEEGVNNAIWIFNPNNESFPPNAYNHPLAYYPGNEYVQLFGITGYNTGTYYAEEFQEEWKEFEQIYAEIDRSFSPYFSEFPWIITEFASSSVGGDKAQWISEMFKTLPKYPKIKFAFWFNSADYDFREENKGHVSRPYWLNETEQTAEAFKNGINR